MWAQGFSPPPIIAPVRSFTWVQEQTIERTRIERGIKQKEFIAKIQIMGCDMNPTSYSKLEGQMRYATDKEIYVITKILGVAMEDLFDFDN